MVTEEQVRVLGACGRRDEASEVFRSDNLSAVSHDLRHNGGRPLNRRYRELLDHYRLRGSLVQVGEAHEDGVVEQAHRRTKSILAQAVAARCLLDAALARACDSVAGEVCAPPTF
jgi:hypothetical protein